MKLNCFNCKKMLILVCEDGFYNHCWEKSAEINDEVAEKEKFCCVLSDEHQSELENSGRS